ncbi:MAG: Flp family type IVb pilin [Pasteurella oralis]|uniref:Flp family type IVb pilin n=1 Tax=Pasteurella oralis TaxID=1071947 RepID=UPI002708E0B0|nr:Flp family type IVb pilin [Pasteurella oralis]
MIYKFFIKFKEHQKGVTSIEYGLISIVIAIFLISIFYNDGSFILALQQKFMLLKSTVVNALK